MCWWDHCLNYKKCLNASKLTLFTCVYVPHPAADIAFIQSQKARKGSFTKCLLLFFTLFSQKSSCFYTNDSGSSWTGKLPIHSGHGWWVGGIWGKVLLFGRHRKRNMVSLTSVHFSQPWIAKSGTSSVRERKVCTAYHVTNARTCTSLSETKPG